MTNKSYNPQALAGQLDYSDSEFQTDMRKNYDINIPDELLYSPKMNHFVLNKVSEINRKNMSEQINPDTGSVFTESEARKYAEENYKRRKEDFKTMKGWWIKNTPRFSSRDIWGYLSF